MISGHTAQASALRWPKQQKFGLFNKNAQALAAAFTRKILSFGNSFLEDWLQGTVLSVCIQFPFLGRRPGAPDAHRPWDSPVPCRPSRAWPGRAALWSPPVNSIGWSWRWHSWGNGTPELHSGQNTHPVCLWELTLHLFFTNFFLEALGFKRLRPAPKVLSRTCRVAERLEMSFSTKGDTPAM